MNRLSDSFGRYLRILALIWVTGFIWSQAELSIAQARASSQYKESIEKGRKILLDFKAERKPPGFSVAVGVNGEIVWSEGFGYADVENRTAVTPLTKFRIGSISKPVTAAAVALLYEQEKLDFDAPVQDYVSSFPQKRGKVTLRNLAGHLAGIRHYRGREFLNSKKYSTVQEGLDIFQADTLLFMPGERYSYSSYAWNLISAAVESQAGTDFLTYMRENVFRPLGMRHIIADHTDSLIAYRTRFYVLNDSGMVLNAAFVDNSYKWAGGGFISNTEDLVRFGTAHLEAGFLRQSTLDLLFTSQKTNSGETTGYGIGWSVGVDDQGRKWRAHGGGSVGGTAFLIIYPESKVVVALLCNLSGARYGDAPRRIAELFME